MIRAALIGLAAAVAVACLTVPAALQPRDYVVRKDLGGEVEAYKAKAERLAAEGRRVVVSGTCASACLYLLTTGNHCATFKARIGFHMPYAVDAKTNRVIDDPGVASRAEALGHQLIRDLPSGLRKHLEGVALPSVHRGAPRDKMIWVSGKAAQEAIGGC